MAEYCPPPDPLKRICKGADNLRMTATIDISPSLGPPALSADPPVDSLRERAFAKFDLAYEKSWPAELGQFWADRYPPCDAPYANLVHARNGRVCALIGTGESLLDIGSGYGDLLYLLRDRFRTLRGVDPSARSCAMATYNLASREVANNFSFDRAVAEDLPCADESFDAAIMLDTYEHIEPAHRDRALAEVRRVLRPGGTLIVVTPSRRIINLLAFFDNLLTLRGQRIMRRKHGTPVHIFGTVRKDYCEQFCTKGDLLADVRRSGLRVERFERCSFYPAPERGGRFYRYFHGKPTDHPNVRRAIRAVAFFERVGFLNQKMLVVARKEIAS